jgi:hypothetical protein
MNSKTKFFILAVLLLALIISAKIMLQNMWVHKSVQNAPSSHLAAKLAVDLATEQPTPGPTHTGSSNTGPADTVSDSSLHLKKTTSSSKPTKITEKHIALYKNTLPENLKDRASFVRLESALGDRAFVQIKIDDADLIGAVITVDLSGETILHNKMAPLKNDLPPFPDFEEDFLKLNIEESLLKQKQMPEKITFLRKFWLNHPAKKHHLAAVEFLTVSRSLETKQLNEELWQFDASNGELLHQYSPNKHLAR